MATLLSPLTLRPIQEVQARIALNWSYEPPYDIYNLLAEKADPDDLAAYLLEFDTGCHAMTDEAGEFLAYCTFGEDARVPGGDYSAEAVDIGLALRPDQTGHGLGGHFIQAVIDFAITSFQPTLLRVTIADFNERAQRAWIREEFTPTQHFMASGWTNKPFTIYVRRISHIQVRKNMAS
ncbi:MAG: GNAT family N-acetyltransferase [Chloroflexi bacterium]|nr:GNAT family N-acetyltransferase [Chloroflexota bacterium]